MDKLFRFLRRLDAEATPYRLERGAGWRTVRVKVESGPEIWHIDFCDDEMTGTIFRATQDLKPSDEDALERLFGRLGKAWADAARDLGVVFQAPFTFEDEQGRNQQCTGLLPHFGGPKGTLITSRVDAPDVFETGLRMGFYASALNPFHYEIYDRTLFVETLRDWGWFGPPEQRPGWLDSSTTG